MKELLTCVANLALLVPSEKMDLIASRIQITSPDKVPMELRQAVGTPAAAGMIERLIDTWKGTTLTPAELALMLNVAGHIHARVSNEQTIELVCTGPTSPYVSTRRTEQVLLQVISGARATLIVTSHLAYRIESVVRALNEASSRGVIVSMFLESSEEQGGRLSFDALGQMRPILPNLRLYTWLNKDGDFTKGSVHAKVAVADHTVCLVTSANLTGYAMEWNIEAGVLINGGNIPRQLQDHLQSLIDTEVLTEIP